MEGHKHVHGGHTSQGTFDPLMAFNIIGIEKGSNVLDAGCGDGYLSMIASRLVGENGKVYSYDIHESSIFILKKRIEHGRFKNIEAEVQDLLSPLPIDDNSLDLIIFSNVIHGFIVNGEMEKIIELIGSKLKNQGELAIIEFMKKDSSAGPPVEDRCSAKELEEHLSTSGLQLKDTHTLSDDHYLSIFRKYTG